MDRVLYIRDGRISSVNRISRSGDETNEEEFLVVDKVGRLQIPQNYLDNLNFEGLAKIDLDDNQMNIKPA